MKRIAAFLIIYMCIADIAKSQDPLFSQFFLNSLDLNPAFAGTDDDPRIFLHYRNNWPGAFEKAFTTYQGSFDQYVKSISGGVGFNILRDNIYSSALTATNIDMIYCYRSKINRTFTLQSAVQLTFQFENFNAGGLTAADPTEQLQSNQITKPDFAIGFLGRSRYSQVGVSLHHLNSGYIKFNYAFIKTPLKITLFYSRNIKIYDKDKVQENGFILSPVIMVQKQAQSYAINYGANFIFGEFLTGFWIRNNIPFQFTSIIFNVGYTFSNFKMGNVSMVYSYDYEVPSINHFMPFTGAHEVSIMLTLSSDPKKKRYGPIKCPDDLF